MHDALEDHPGYHSKMDEIDELSEDYNSSKYDSKDKGTESNIYKSTKEKEKDKQEPSEFEKQLEEGQKPKYNNKETDDETIKRKAAAEIHKGSQQLKLKKENIKKKTISNIDEAIEKAIKEEKEVIHLD
ncbi:MAG: hypothetical protein KAK00_06635 [Nanoarchaeota archaeon]|nr:hypothetical protein [Nanoarchaeota archaeon]